MDMSEISGRLKEKLIEISKFISGAEIFLKRRGRRGFSPSESISEEDLVGLEGIKHSEKFLGSYSIEQIKHTFAKLGLFDELKKRGFDNFIVRLNTSDPFKHRVAVYFDSVKKDKLLGEFVSRVHYLEVNTPEVPKFNNRTIKTLYIEWLMLQNPLGEFTVEKPQLPGQRYPGLGLGHEVFSLIAKTAQRLDCQAILNVPDQYHNATLYAKNFLYLNPYNEGLLQALSRDLSGKWKIGEISKAFDRKCLIKTETNKPFEWFTGKQLTPLNRNLYEYFKTDYYVNLKRKAMEENHVTIDEKAWDDQ